MGRLLEACPELPGDRLHGVTARLHRPGEGRIGHDHRGRRIVGERPPRQPFAVIRGEAAVLQRLLHILPHLKIDELERELELLAGRSEGHTSELQSLMRISYAVFCLKKKKIY